MKIDYISSEGISRSEKTALDAMHKAFNASQFSQSWQGYAGFMMMDTTSRDREIDLVLLTHDRLLIIELKNWRGKVEPMQDHWLKDGNDMGRSPVRVLADKWKILSSKIQDRLQEPAKSVWIDYRVVMCGTADYSEISPDEKAYVLSLDEFLRIAKESGYRQILGEPRRGKPSQHIPQFTQFFRGKDFKASGFSFNNFQIVGDATFPHPNELYQEYKAVKKDDQRHEALLRRWNFSALVGYADTVDERARIALREHQVLGFIHEKNEDLDKVVLQPLSHPTRDDVDADFCELYKLPSRQSRLGEFVNRHGVDLSTADRMTLLKVLLSHFADVHDTGVAHRDVGDHNIWLERPAKISLSGFVTAYFPEAGTVGKLRDSLRAGKAVLPEDSEIGHGEHSDAFRRDVYLLGVVAHQLLYLAPPRSEDGLYLWEEPDEDLYQRSIHAWFDTALALIPSDRFANARVMLHELNAITLAGTGPAPLDLQAFDTFHSEVNPLIVYPILDTIKSGHSHLYKSTLGGRPVSVKIWYGRKPDEKRPQETLQLQDFLEKARLLKMQPCESLPEIMDFGWSDPGAFLVQSWQEGTPLKDACREGLSAQDALQLCQALVAATLHLHGLDLTHGDLHPDNVLLDGAAVRFIDAVDLVPGGGSVPYNPAYVPIDHEATPLDQRDCYAVAKMCNEILDQIADWGTTEPDTLRKEIQQCLERSLKVYALDRIGDALKVLLNPPLESTGPKIEVRLRQLTSAERLTADNGEYHISVWAEEGKSRQTPGIAVSILGVRKRLLLLLDPEDLRAQSIRLLPVQHSEFVRLAGKANSTIDIALDLVPAPADDTEELVETLQAIPTVQEAIKQARAPWVEPEEESDTDDLVSDPALPRPTPATAAIWKAILEAEEATLPEVEIAGPVSREFGRTGKVRIPYSNEGEPLDYAADAKVEALQEVNGELMRVGELNIRETSPFVLVLDNPRLRLQQSLGEKIKLRSQQDLSSFRRRQKAVTRILQRESVLPNLIDYFDPLRCPAPQTLEQEPTDAELDAYNRTNEDGQITFTLNAQQRQAFRKLWTQGPLSLLQGPPGTGKTSFIASFIHYALTQGAKSILLASQSHEAVNNAAEKVVELCERNGQQLDLVRFGAEGMISTPLRPHHASSILQSYRELFRAEMRERVVSLSRNLGLPTGFVTAWFDLDFDLGKFHREILKLHSKWEDLAPGDPGREALSARINARTESFRAVAADKYGHDASEIPDDILQQLQKALMETYAVTSRDAITRLGQVIGMAQEWVDRLGTLNGNFEEFLAKTRTLVCGTCVGLGRSQFGVAKHRYDWVIVDEAARATPGELAVAIQSGRRILLVGDHRQLSPLFTQALEQEIASKLAWPDRTVLTRSDFERAFESEYGHQVGATLRTQYRMAPPIGDLVSTCFYPIPLSAGRGEPEPWLKSLPDRAKSIVTWIDTSQAGREAWDRQNNRHGCDNPYEAREILDLLREICSTRPAVENLLADDEEDKQPIGVICMYADQKRLLLKMLSEQNWAIAYRHLIKIDTVDSYQGKENRIIILSLTRYNARFEQGFLKSPERVNVALSRAMDRLIIVGAAQMWRERHQSSPLGRVLEYIEQHRDGQAFNLLDANTTTRGKK